MTEFNNPQTWLEDHGDMLYRYALKQVRNADQAEDLVQEAFLAAWKSRDKFDGRSAVRTWLVGILRHKILDHFRKSKRESPATDPEAFDVMVDSGDFDASGHWQQKPSAWGDNPHDQLENGAFMQVFDDCLEHLPETMAHAFILRNVEDVDTEEACNVLGVTSTNLYVLLYRARMQMRKCLEMHWFAG